MHTINEDHMMYGSWDIRHNKQNFFSYWIIFCSFTPPPPPKNLKNQSFGKMKNKPEDIIVLHLQTTNDDHMMNGSWDMERDRQNFLSFWTIFCPFTPLTTQKFKILKKWKNVHRYYHFKHVYHKWKSYDVWF